MGSLTKEATFVKNTEKLDRPKKEGREDQDLHFDMKSRDCLEAWEAQTMLTQSDWPSADLIVKTHYE